MFNKEIESFENLLKSRLAGVLPVVKQPRAVRRREWQRAYDARRNATPERIAYKKKYYDENRDKIIEKKRQWNASPHGKRVNSEYGKYYRQLKGEAEKARKRAWYHANKVLKGTPRGRKPKAKTAAENLEQTNLEQTKQTLT